MGLITPAQGFAMSRGLYIDFTNINNSTVFTPTFSFKKLVSNTPIDVINLPGYGYIFLGNNDTFSFVPPDTFISRLNALNLSFHGNTKVKQMFENLINGEDSLDIVLIGDSNVGYSVTTGIYGYANGICNTLISLGVPVYASNLIPCLSRTAAAPGSYKYMSEAGVTTVDPGRTANQSGVSWLIPGNETEYTEISALWNSGSSNELSPSGGNTRLDWSFLDTGAVTSGSYYIEVSSVFGIKVPITYRVGYATFPSGGLFYPRIYLTSGITLSTTTVNSTRNVSGALYEILELSATPSDKNNLNIRCSKFAGSTAATSPCGFLFESVVKQNTKGFSVSSYLHRSGGQTNTNIKAAIQETESSTLKIFVKELRDRQIYAGGSGKVVFFTNSGVNGNEISADWLTGVQALVSSIRNAWLSNGFPEEDLGIITSTTAPPDANYISTSYTQWTAQNTVGINNSGFFEFSFISMSTLTSSAELTSNLYHAGAGNTVHLSNAGYNFVSNKIIQQLINVDPIDTLRYGGDIQQNGYLSPFEENYHKTGLKLFKKLK